MAGGRVFKKKEPPTCAIKSFLFCRSTVVQLVFSKDVSLFLGYSVMLAEIT